MKRICICLLWAWLAAGAAARAQMSEGQDSLPAPTLPPSEVMQLEGGYLLDMKLLQLEAATEQLGRYHLQVPDASRDWSRLFRLHPDVIYSSGLSDVFYRHHSPYSYYGTGSLWGFGTDRLQMGTFRLKNGMRLHTYGQYDKDGWRVPDPSALPWQRDNFKGAFELKSQDGSFGIRIEVQRGRQSPF